MLAGHSQNEKHEQVADQMVAAGMHESPRDEPPELALEHLVAMRRACVDDAADVGQLPDHELSNINQDAGQHQDDGRAGEDAHPGFEVDALLMEHLVADDGDLVVTVRGDRVRVLGDRADALPESRVEA